MSEDAGMHTLDELVDQLEKSVTAHLSRRDWLVDDLNDKLDSISAQRNRIMALLTKLGGI